MVDQRHSRAAGRAIQEIADQSRAAKFAEDWNGARYERGNTQTFYNEFFELFRVPRRRVASFEHGVNLPDKKRGYLDLFWKGKLLVEQKSAGRSLTPARLGARSFSGPQGARAVAAAKPKRGRKK